MIITIQFQDHLSDTRLILRHVEFVRLVALDSIEVKCWGNGSVIHRKIKSFKIDYEVPKG